MSCYPWDPQFLELQKSASYLDLFTEIDQKVKSFPKIYNKREYSRFQTFPIYVQYSCSTSLRGLFRCQFDTLVLSNIMIFRKKRIVVVV